ncbi:MAG: hypothetical protein AMXMBFR7_33580 [Planctomycetota bacterium]
MRLFSPVLGCLMAIAMPLAAAEPENVEQLKTAALAKEKEGHWKQVAWEADAAAAVRKSQASGKPLFVVLIVGHLARPNASEC